MTKRPAPAEPQVIALLALAELVGNERMAMRFLSLSGLTAGDLRAGASTPVMQRAVLDFLAGHEPDLLAVAASIGFEPADLEHARTALESL